MLVVIFVVILLAVTLASWELLRPKADPIGERLGVKPRLSAKKPRESLIRRMGRGIAGRLGRTSRRMLPQNFVHNIDRQLVMANEPWGLVPFLGAWAASAVGGLLFVL